MLFPINWILEHMDITLKTDASITNLMCETLNRIGFETTVHSRVPDFSAYCVAFVENVEKHPNADRLNVCNVFDGSNYLQIVCGAQNVRAGMFAVLAPVGTIMPSQMEIKLSKIRSVESQGMLCSFSELEIDNFFQNDGIADLFECEYTKRHIQKRLAQDQKQLCVQQLFAGQKFSDTLCAFLVSDVISVEFTSNRRDAANVFGLARELCAAGFGNLSQNIKQVNVFESSEKIAHKDVGVVLRTSAIASEKSAAAYYKIVDVTNCESPLVVKSRISASGVKVISALVDVTNYVAHEIGQPLHAFDADKVIGDARIELTKEQKKFLALDGNEYEIADNFLIITDDTHIPIALAGIIGGASTACSFSTRNVLLESGYFTPELIVKAGRATGISTHARYRFERSSDKSMVLPGLRRAAEMISEICKCHPENYVTSSNFVADYILGDLSIESRYVTLRMEKLHFVSGIKFCIDEVMRILESLGFCIKSENGSQSNDVIVVRIPPHRFYDIAIEEDLVEEVMRIYGYDNIPEVELPTKRSVGKNEFDAFLSAKKFFASLGYHELITWSFVSNELAEMFSAECEAQSLDDKCNAQQSVPQQTKNEFEVQPNILGQIEVAVNCTKAPTSHLICIANPISADMSVMRPSPLPNLIDALVNHKKRNIPVNGFFEIGPIYRSANNENNLEDTSSLQEIAISGVLNFEQKATWRKEKQHDVFDVKATVMSFLLDFFSIAESDGQFENTENQWLHGANLMFQGKVIATMGVPSQKVCKHFDVLQNTFGMFTVYLSRFSQTTKHIAECSSFLTKESDALDLSLYQAVERDYSFTIQSEQPEQSAKIGTLVNSIDVAIRAIANVHLQDIYVFDVFAISESAQISVGIRIIIRPSTETFSDHDLQKIQTTVIAAAATCNAKLRTG